MRKLNILLLIISLVGLLVVFFSRKKYTYFKPTSDYYIYDDNNYLLSSTKYSIYLNSLNLFDTTKEINSIGGTQIVLMALSNKEEFNTTTLFNEWEIGLNDMGLLIILYFDDSDIPVLTNYSYEAGIKMFGYLPAYSFNDLVDTHLLPYNNEIDLMIFYYELLNYIYINIYNYSSFNYDINNYIDVMYDSFHEYLPSSNSNNLLLFDDYSTIKIILFIVFGLSTLGNASFFIVNKGMGGKSIGYKYER